MTPLAKQLRACRTHDGRLKLLEKHSPGADLSGAELSCMDLHGGNFVGANLRWVNLAETYLSYSNFSRADFSMSNLSHSNLSHSSLIYSNFNRADVRDTNLSGADLSGANFHGTYLCKYGPWDVRFKDGQVRIECKTKPSIAAWDKWFAGVEEFKIKRGTEKFEKIRANWEWAKGIWRRTQE